MIGREHTHMHYEIGKTKGQTRWELIKVTASKPLMNKIHSRYLRGMDPPPT